MGKTKQNGILHRLRKNIMCGVLSCVLVLGAVLTMPGMWMTAKAGEIIYKKDGIDYRLDDTALKGNIVNCNITSEEVYIPASIVYDDKPYKIEAIEGEAFKNCKNLKKVTLEEGIKDIYDVAFAGTSIEEIEFPASISNINRNILGNCTNLKKIRFRGTDVPNLCDGWIGSKDSNIIIEIPEGADRSKWEDELHSSGYDKLIGNIQIYTPASSSLSSTSSPNQENNSNGEVEFIEEEPVNRIPEHVCQYEWEDVREVGSDQDGLEQYLCKLCGNVQSTLTIPASQYQVQELYTKVTGSGEGETVTYDTGMVHTVCDKLFTKLQERKDVTLVITYQYKGESYRTTFPAGADYTELLQDEDQFYGMLGLNGRCGIVTEKN